MTTTPTPPPWQEISSAPRDGTWIEGKWNDEESYKCHFCNGYWRDEKELLCSPKYWRPILPAEPAPVTGTPRTDNHTYGGKGIIGAGYVSADFARTLETELAAANLHRKTCVHHTDAERAEITCPVCLKESDEPGKPGHVFRATMRRISELTDSLYSSRPGICFVEDMAKERDQLRAALAETLAKLEEAENTSDDLWLSAIAKHWNEFKGVPWDTMDGECREEGIEANVVVLFSELDDLRAANAALTKERDDFHKIIVELRNEANGARQHRWMLDIQKVCPAAECASVTTAAVAAICRQFAALARLVTAADGTEDKVANALAAIRTTQTEIADYEMPDKLTDLLFVIEGELDQATDSYARAKQEAGV